MDGFDVLWRKTRGAGPLWRGDREKGALDILARCESPVPGQAAESRPALAA